MSKELRCWGCGQLQNVGHDPYCNWLLWEGTGDPYLENIAPPIKEELTKAEEEIKKLKDMLGKAAPLMWAFHQDCDAAAQWEKEVYNYLNRKK